jgi:catechol 2,3-dioxygenase-like lactoylglutathione lyase family enzyme
MPYAGNEMLATTGPDGEKPNEVSDMLSYLSIGANDVEASAKFYDAVLLPLGYENDSRDEECSSYFLPGTRDRDNGPGTVHVGKPFDGKPATPGNGMMPAFRADSRNKVDLAYAAGLRSGGTDEGRPGTRAAYTQGFYVAYLRDPVGNKLALFYAGDEREGA